MKRQPLQLPLYCNISEETRSRETTQPGMVQAFEWKPKKSRNVYPLHCDSTILVSGLVTYCMLSVLLNWSDASSGSPGRQSELIWRPHSPPTATPKYSRILFHLVPGGKQLIWVWFLLLLIQALSGWLHEARQPFARQRPALGGNQKRKGGGNDRNKTWPAKSFKSQE